METKTRNKVIVVVLAFAVLASLLLSGCAVVSQAAQNVEVKTGLAVVTSFSKSKDAAADADGLAQADITLVAVTVDDEGRIDQCVIDTVQAKVNFAADGTIKTDLSATFPGKVELGDGYGMKAASAIGKEWYEQAAALEAYVEGKTIAEVLAIGVDDAGKATDADLVASASITISGYLKAIAQAAENAQHLGGHKGDALKLASVTNIKKSKDAAADADGLAQAYATVGAITLNADGVVTSCLYDAVQANVNFNAAGAITSDLAAGAKTKNELGDGYGMRAASGIGKEWFEQAAAFAEYAKGKKIADAVAVKVEDGKAVDLVSSVTIGVDDFVAILAAAAK